LVLAENGLVGARARDAFQQALALDAENAKALFYRGMAERQDGKHEQALATWRYMLEHAPADAAWRPAVERQMASLVSEQSGAPQISEQDIASADELEGSEREAMIRGMVDGLAERLEREGGDLQGWLRLARARMVLGEREAADAALRDAERYFSGDIESLGQIAETRESMGLGGPGNEAGP
jgi:cytochrome c-type biogenesis protein CcmH